MLDIHHNQRYTIKLLDLLHLTDEEFQSLHHHGDEANQSAHRAYCEKTQRFQAWGTNAETAKRIEDELLRRLRTI